MSRKFGIFAALAIFATLLGGNANVIKDAEEFIKDSISELSNIRAQCQVITNDIEKIYTPELKNKISYVEALNYCGRMLREIGSKAATYDLAKIDDVKTKETIRKFRNIEERYKLGADVFALGANWAPFAEAYVKEDIEYFDDSDILYSLKEIEIGEFITRIEDVNEINYYWSHVADKVSVYTWKNFFDFVDVVKQAAKEYNMTAAEFWYPDYSETTMDELNSLMKELKPFYEQLHAYLRFKLLSRYGSGVVKPNGPIPETLYRQVEDRIWSNENHYEEDFPYKNMLKMFRTFEAKEMKTETLIINAEQYYKSLGFEGIGDDYWKAHITQKDDGDNCEEIFDDSMPKSLKFNYCCEFSFMDFLKYHEFVGRIHGAKLKSEDHWFNWNNNAWGKIIGDAVKLSAFTKSNLERLEYMADDDLTDEWMETINVRLAFENLFMLVRKYVNLRVVTDLFADKIEKENVNAHYWTIFGEFAGVEPPIDRTDESLDLPYSLVQDVFTNKNFIRDFKQGIQTYEVYKAACHLADYTGPLHQCDFYGNKKVGEAFKQILSTGYTKPFESTIEPLMPKYTKSSAAAFLAYYEPTFSWMKDFNRKHNLTTGWDRTKKSLSEVALTREEEATEFVEESSKRIYELYDQIASDLFSKKNFDEEYESDFYGNTFWKTSKAALAATELTEISMKAKRFDNTKFKSKPLRKAISKLAQIADVFVLGADMTNIDYNKQLLFNMSLDNDIDKYKDDAQVSYNPYILNVFRTSKDAEELKFYWNAWRERNGAFAKQLLIEIFKSFEEAANKLEIATTEFWFKHYSNDYVKKMEIVIDAMKPFYKDLHYYVSRELLKKYSQDDFSMIDGSLPDHFVQQVQMQIWSNESIVEDDFPYEKLPPYEPGFESKKFDAAQLYKIADEFYQSLGFDHLDATFWSERFKFEEGISNDSNCRATIYDLTPKAYVKYCERVIFRNFLQAHGYMGRVHYAAEKQNLPSYYFDSYDFEYPVGEAVILSAGAPKHAEKLGFFTDFQVTEEVLLNRQMRMAIHTMFNLHRYFVHTKVVAEYLEGELESKDIAKTYWNYMIVYAGIEPPMDRKDDTFDFPFDFYTDLEQNHQVKKFVSEILGYRIYERLCKLSGHQGDLNNCDFSGSVQAGQALKSMMKLGSSLPRNTVLKRLMQDVSGLNADALLAYYAPLRAWLKQKIEDKNNSFDSYRQCLHAEYFA